MGADFRISLDDQDRMAENFKTFGEETVGGCIFGQVDLEIVALIAFLVPYDKGRSLRWSMNFI